ncbi:MAG: hypothetical protein FJ216_00965 [Ignavibacteria bacterium]|nr:hypothetical protein [Ignavibacteria bacterium]
MSAVKKILPLVMFIIITLQVNEVFSQKYYFYTGKKYGSESMYNPINFFLNSGYDIIQYDKYSKNILKYPYGTGFKNVGQNLINPIGPINRYGWWNFFKREVLPFAYSKDESQWFPNYQLHLLGGGLTYAALEDWYRYNKFSYPKTLAFTTKMMIDYMCESVENGDYVGDDVSVISDMYIFNLGGAILFSFEGVKKFFSEKLNFADWSLQPSFTIPTVSLENNGQYFSMKWKIPYIPKIHLFYFFGMTTLTGLSYKFDSGDAISIGVGARASDRFVTDPRTNRYEVAIAWDLGFFYDRNNSLMTSLFYSVYTENRLSLNVYPGLFKFGNLSPGFWVVLKNNGKMMFGLTTSWAPGIAFK